jgi:biopolymer transport protein ExbD
MSKWDILHVKSLEVDHGVSEEAIRRQIEQGKLTREDCVRKEGEEQWWRIYEVDEFRAADRLESEQAARGQGSLRSEAAEEEPAQVVSGTARKPGITVLPESGSPHAFSMTGEDLMTTVLEEPDEGLPYQKRHHEEQEELDMTPMVDVAMQLILFFMVTSSMVMQMCLSFPKPALEETNRPQVTQTVQKLDDLKTDHIIVKIKADNSVLVDEEKQPTKDTDLKEKLESIKHARNPNGGIVIQADESAYHETVVKVVDAANLARIEPIKMANPKKQAKKTTKKRAIK